MISEAEAVREKGRPGAVPRRMRDIRTEGDTPHGEALGWPWEQTGEATEADNARIRVCFQRRLLFLTPVIHMAYRFGLTDSYNEDGCSIFCTRCQQLKKNYSHSKTKVE